VLYLWGYEHKYFKANQWRRSRARGRRDGGANLRREPFKMVATVFIGQDAGSNPEFGEALPKVATGGLDPLD